MFSMFHYVHLFAYINILSAMYGVYQIAFSNNVTKALLQLFLCGLCVVADSVLTKIKKGIDIKAKSFGLQINALAGIVAFGVLPCLIVYTLNPSLFIFPCLGIYVLATITKLASSLVFCEQNTEKPQVDKNVKECFTNIPVASIAFILPAYQFLPLQGDWTSFIVTNILMFVMSSLFLVKVLTKSSKN